jgi:Conserved hypothetical protein 698
MVDRPTHLIMRGGLAVCRRVVEEALLRRTVRGPAPACMRSPRSSPRRRRRGAAALATPVVVKLARVIMLAPLVAIAAFLARRCTKVDPESGSRRPPLVPLFVMGFLIMIVVRSTGIQLQQVLDVAGDRGSRLRRSVAGRRRRLNRPQPATPTSRGEQHPAGLRSSGIAWMQIRFVFDHKREDDRSQGPNRSSSITSTKTTSSGTLSPRKAGLASPICEAHRQVNEQGR